MGPAFFVGYHYGWATGTLMSPKCTCSWPTANDHSERDNLDSVSSYNAMGYTGHGGPVGGQNINYELNRSEQARILSRRKKRKKNYNARSASKANKR